MPRGTHGAAAQDLVARGQQRILQFMAKGRPLREVLGELCTLVDRHAPRSFSCVLLADPEGRRLRFGAGPKVPLDLIEILSDANGFEGSEAFGAAAILAGRPWETQALEADPGWGDWGPLARGTGLESWTALPILGPERQVLGAFALGRREAGDFPEAELGLLRSSVGLASIAIQHEQRQEALIASERLARSILDASPLGIQVFNADGHSVALNRARRLLADRKDHVLNAAFNVLRDPQSLASGLAEHYQAAFRGEVVERPVVEVQDPSKAGQTEFFHQVLYPVKDNAGAVTAVVSMSRDITEQINAEKALREEKARFEALVRNAVDLIFTVDGRALIRYTSPSVFTVLGFRPEEVQGRPALDLLHPEDHARALEAVQLMLDERASHPVVELRARHRDGSLRWLLIRGTNQLDNPAVRGLVFNSSDITDLKAATEAAAEREQRLRLVLDGTQDATWDWDLTSGTVQHNERWAAITGDEAGQSGHPVQSWAARVHPQDMARVMDSMNAHFQGKSDQYLMEYRFLHREGRWVWVLDRGKVVHRDAQGSPLRLAGTMADISARKEAEIALKSSEERLRAVVAALPDTYLRIDETGAVLDMEGHGEILEGLKGLPLGRPLRESRLPEPLVEALLATVGEAIASGKTREFRKTVPAAGGELHFEVRVRRAGDSEALCLLRDITEQHHTEEYLRQNQKLESLGLLAGGIAHDFNNLFQGLMGNLNLAELQVGADSPARPVLQRMEGIVRRAADLTQRLMDYSGKGFFLVKQTQLSQTLMELAEMLKLPIPNQVTLRFDLLPDLPACELDQGQLQQVLLNLVINAVEAIGAEEGTITLATRVEFLPAGPLEHFTLEPAGRGPHVVLEVRDDGSGMDEQQLAHCFDPFFSTRFPGRGLGLPAVIGILRRHRGGVRVQSTVSVGSVFSLYFPVAEPLEVKSSTPSDSQGTLLLADDEAVVRQVTGEVLRSLGYAVVEAVDGVDALERFMKAPQTFSMAILDLVMPRMDGYATFHALRKVRPDLPVVFISGYSREEVPLPAEVRGHAGFLQKPFQMSQLAQVLDSIRNGR